MRYLGIDYGTKRVGTALSDKLGLIATSYQLLLNDVDLVKNIDQIVNSQAVGAIVMGLPKHMHNELSETATKVFELRDQLLYLGIPIYFQDERRSTHEAEQVLISANVSRQNRKQKIDNLAATIILQTYLDTCQKP